MGVLSVFGIFKRRKVIQKLKYILLLTVIGVYIRTAFILSNYMYDGSELNDVVRRHEIANFLIVQACLGVSAYMAFPISVLNVIGLVISNPFSNETNQGPVTKETPFICFRVVTKGMFPRLVAEVTQKNLELCRNIGLRNFKFEIVTDRALNLNLSTDVREIVVPNEYRTTNHALFKARALHYCLEDSINILANDDWVTHLDEETQLTESAIHGIVEFITKPESHIGQGVITYGCGDIENWLTTLLDGFRVNVDYGLFRLGLEFLHIPVFGIKGSFVVVKMHVEKKIGFDFGPTESIAEDLRFVLTAWHHGYRFDFVKGIMQEKSTFTVSDYIKQRKRWFIGHNRVIWSRSLPPYYKVAIFILNTCNMLLWLNIVGTIYNLIFPAPFMKWQLNVVFLQLAHGMFLLAFGNFMSISSSRYSLCTRLIISTMSQFLVYIMIFLDAFAYFQGFVQRNQIRFEIVQKETTGLDPKPSNKKQRLEAIVEII